MVNSGPTNYRKTPQDTARHPQDTARHCKTATRHCKGPQERRMQGYYRYSGVWWWWCGGGGGRWRPFLLHFCTNCEKTKFGNCDVTKKNVHNFFLSFVFSQFVQKCNKNVLPKNFVTTPPPSLHCTEDSEYSKHTAKLLDKLVERGYDKTLTQDQINKVFQTPRNELLSTNTKPVNNPNILAVTYNKNLPDLRKAINDNWKTLSINSNIAPLFTDKPVIAFRRNRNLKQLLCKHKLHNNKPIIRKEKKLGRCQPCLSRANNKCCKQMANTNHFNRKNGRKFNIYHNLSCESNNVIYLIECTLCNYKPYIGKSEPATNLRINNHRSDCKKQDSIPVDQHFPTPGHNFTAHARITLIEKLENTTYMTEEEVTTFLETREDFWMIKLDTLIPDGFNQALNYPR